ncbi:type VII secretion protein EccE [Actinoplanes xinjiangensis]|uniref:type VII secretion protein EccE n=1 Tax=Actinoplanes xinjiangensis TaxID=512350 RepID=UPI00341AD58A
MHRGEGTTYRAAPPPPVPVRAVPRRGHLGSLSLAQILVAEGVLLVLAASLAAGPAVLLAAGAASAALLFAFFSRRQNRWWLEHRQVARDHRRRRAARIDARPGPVLAALRTVAPGLTVQDVTASDGTVGVARDEAGWFSVVMLDPAAAPLPLDALLGILAGTGQPGLVLELVTHTVPAPSPDVPAASPSGASYRRLTEATGAGPVPSYRESSVSIRVDARALAEALLDHTADPEAAATLVAGLARKLVTSLRRLGVTGRALDTERLLALLARSCDVEPWALADGPGVDEAWTHWRSARLVHRTYWLHTWPASATEIGSLFAWASTAPAAQTSVALVLGASSPHAGDDVPVRAFIRLATRPDADLRALDRVLVEGVRRAGGELQPLDGEQGPAAYATAPTGGGAG